MNNLELLNEALEYIEQHMKDDIRTEDIADVCFCSKSSLEKLFRNVAHISVHEYIIRRRMTKAARTLIENPDMSVLDAALEYGYSSHEAFTRKFYEKWNCLPSKYRKNKRVLEIFPKINLNMETGGYNNMGRKFDISELYDLFKSRKDCYFVCGDIRSLIPINEISIKAGDLAILESLKRMEDAAGEDDVVFRIGGDEFVILTNSTEESYAKSIADTIVSHNGECIHSDGRDIPLSLYVSYLKIANRTLRYSELFVELNESLMKEKYQKIADVRKAGIK